MSSSAQRILMGNEAIGRGLVEYGCDFFAAYPGTPSSEIMTAAVGFAQETASSMHLEWSVNEKVAYEAALANSYTGKRSAAAMKQVGLNVAADPFMRSAYLGVKGGFVILVADDPGPHSSQTEQDSRFFAQFAKIPVLDPSSPAEAKEMVRTAFELSEQYEIPVMLRPTTRVCHARQNVSCEKPVRPSRPPHFEKNPGRWIATPQFLPELHRKLNEKIAAISLRDDFRPRLFKGNGSHKGCCIVASGVAFAHAWDLLDDLGLRGTIDLFQVTLPYPLHQGFIEEIRTAYDHILVIEETYPVIETQLLNPKVDGRRSGLVPSRGEVTPDVVARALEQFLNLTPVDSPTASPQKGKRPSLCAGCSHRAAYYAIKQTFPNGIFPSDIGCYTLGMNFGAIDTCHCMGACINQGEGFFFAYRNEPNPPTIVVSIGDSTFFHAGIPGLINAVFQKARFIVVILDNATTAMTGNQPTPQNGITADGSPGKPVLIPELVKACGVDFIRQCDPYDLDALTALLREADAYCRSAEGGIAVIICKHPCQLDRSGKKYPVFAMSVTDACTGCEACLNEFECPALILDNDAGQVIIDQNLCTGCGICVHVCPMGAIEARGK